MIYNIFVFLIWLAALPFLAIFSLKKKYRKSLPARFFLFKNPPNSKSEIHFHACSLGEVKSIEPLLAHFEDAAITVITNTGFAAARQITSNSRFLPFEWFLPFWLKKRKILVVFEAELWLNLFKYSRKFGAYTVLLNARISDKSYPKYLKFKPYYKKIFQNVDLVMAQSQKDKERLENLGAKNVEIWGNIKSANLPKITKNYPKFEYFTLTIASTHDGEEELILSHLEAKNMKIILAPRHPERFEKVHEIFSEFAMERGLSYERFSANLGLNSRCILLDTIGELVNFYRISDAVILGGSFVPNIGGHNPAEVANFEIPLINGKFYHNQTTLFEMVENVYFADASEINSLLNSKLTPARIKNRFEMAKFVQFLKEKL